MKTNELKKIRLDVRDDIKKGADPFQTIMSAVNSLKEDETLELINSFEPFPLYSVLKNKGFEHTTKHTENGFEILFFRDGNRSHDHENLKNTKTKEVDEENNFSDEDLKKLAHSTEIEIDVRGLEPPQPLLKIFEILENMDNDKALSITHERKPIHLYPRLKDAGYKYLTKETKEDLYSIKVWR